MRRLPLFIVLPLVSIACATDLDGEDPRDEDVIVDGKADAFGLVEGSPEAEGVLELVNTAPRETLRDEVKLGAVATDGILAHRVGPDNVDDTSDDDLYDTLEELDHIAYVGATSFTKLLSFARANGYVPAGGSPSSDPFDPSSCAGPPMQLAEIDQRLGTLGLYQFKIRERTCVDQTQDCTDWHAVSIPELSWGTQASGEAKLGKTDGGDRGLWLISSNSCRPSINSSRTWSGAYCTGLAGEVTCSAYVDCDSKALTVPGFSTPFDEPYIKFSGTLTSRCVRLAAKAERALVLGGSNEPQRTKYWEAVVLVTY